MPSDYVYAATKDKRLFALYKRGDESPQPHPARLKAWRQTIIHGRLLFYARQRERAAKSQIDRLRQRILQLRGNDQTAGFIGRYGTQWFRVLFVTSQPKLELAKPGVLLQHVGDLLPRVATTITLQLSSQEYLFYDEWRKHAQMSDDEPVVTAIDLDTAKLERLVAAGTIPKLPTGTLVPAKPKDPSIDIKTVQPPKLA